MIFLLSDFPKTNPHSMLPRILCIRVKYHESFCSLIFLQMLQNFLFVSKQDQLKIGNIKSSVLQFFLKDFPNFLAFLCSGLVRTEIFRHIEQWLGPVKFLVRGMALLFTKSPTQGAQTTIYCAVDETLVNIFLRFTKVEEILVCIFIKYFTNVKET